MNHATRKGPGRNVRTQGWVPRKGNPAGTKFAREAHNKQCTIRHKEVMMDTPKDDTGD